MQPFRPLALAAIFALLSVPFVTLPANAQASTLTQKINAYVGCINRLSERSYQSHQRYFSWVGKKGPTGKERIIYGTYTIYDTSDCKKNVEAANALEPREPELEAAASVYVEAVVALEPLLKQANDYYDQQDYKDDRMAKGKALHPKLVAAWKAFASADVKLRAAIDVINDKQAIERLAGIESTEGRKARYHVESLMIRAKHLLRTENTTPPNISKITEALTSFEAMVRATEDYAAANKDSRIDSSLINDAKNYLGTAKRLMRRLRDKVPYSSGERMILNSGGGGWMVEGSPARLTRDYNQLIESYNRSLRF